MKADNPPAFPTHDNVHDPRTDGYVNINGMSLADYFAARAMQSQIAIDGMEGCDKFLIAAMSFEIAGAMLEARNDFQNRTQPPHEK